MYQNLFCKPNGTTNRYKLFFKVSRVIDINILPSQSRYHVRKHISFENAASLIKHQAFSYGCLSS